jgi:hypothetical protein
LSPAPTRLSKHERIAPEHDTGAIPHCHGLASKTSRAMFAADIEAGHPA